MARGGEAGLGPWAVFALLLISSAVVLGVEWRKECDGKLKSWLLIAVCVTAVCGILGAAFHGTNDSSRPLRFLDQDGDDYADDDYDDESYIDGESATTGSDRGGSRGMDLGPLGTPVRTTAQSGLPVLKEGEQLSTNSDVNGVSGAAAGTVEEEAVEHHAIDDGITSAHGSSVSAQFATRASSSLQRQYFGPGPKVFPDAIFLVLVLSQWFLAAWSVVGAILYFRLFEPGRTCPTLLRHWTLLVVIIGFLSCLLAVCYSGIMCCMLGSPFEIGRNTGSGRRERGAFHGDLSADSNSSDVGVVDPAGMI